tara:strand:+ start:359 stop:1609 length:1251 start_codon:yes stop_codon:yes gene_type:complete
MKRGLIVAFMLLLSVGLVSAACGDDVCDPGERGSGSADYCIEDCEKNGVEGDYCVTARDCSYGGDCVDSSCTSIGVSASVTVTSAEQTLCIVDSDCFVDTEVCGIDGYCKLIEEELDVCDTSGLCAEGFECVNDYCKEILNEVNIPVDSPFYFAKRLEEGLIGGMLSLSPKANVKHKQKLMKEREKELVDVRERCTVGPSTKCDGMRKKVDRRMSSTVESASKLVEKNKDKLEMFSGELNLENFETSLASFEEGGSKNMLAVTEAMNAVSDEKFKKELEAKAARGTLKMEMKGIDPTKIGVGKGSVADVVAKSKRPGLSSSTLPSGVEVNVPSVNKPGVSKPKVTKPKSIEVAKASKPNGVNVPSTSAQKAQKKPSAKLSSKKKPSAAKVASAKKTPKKKRSRATGGFVRSLLYKK